MRGDGLMKEVMEGKMEGKWRPGRKRLGMIRFKLLHILNMRLFFKSYNMEAYNCRLF